MGIRASQHLNLSSVARIDYLKPPSDYTVSTPLLDNLLAVERLWVESTTGSDGEELIGKVLNDPALLSKIRLNGVAYNDERLILLSHAALRWDVDANLYNFIKQPGQEVAKCIIRISQSGIATILCNASHETEEYFLALLEKSNFQMELCRW